MRATCHGDFQEWRRTMTGFRAGSLVFALVAPCAIASTGCVNNSNTRTPTLAARGDAAYERREAQIQDPFPDRDMGPDTQTRPRDFAEQRPEVQRAKDRAYSATMRTRITPQPGPAFPGTGEPAPFPVP
jgi:hypothetical protein